MPEDSNIQEQARKTWEEARKKLLTLGHQTVELAKKGEEEVLRYTELGRLKWDILVLKRKMDGLYAKLGKKVFTLESKGHIDQPDVKELCAQIRSLQDQVKDKEVEIAETKKKKD